MKSDVKIHGFKVVQEVMRSVGKMGGLSMLQKVMDPWQNGRFQTSDEKWWAHVWF